MSTAMSDASQLTQEMILSRATDLWERWDGYVGSTVLTNLELIGFQGMKNPSPVTRDWLFVRSPTLLVTAMLVYLTLVFLGVMYHKVKGSRGEKKRDDPMILRVFVQCHNLFLIVLSSYMCGTSIYEAARNNYKFWGTGYKTEEVGMTNIIYIFYVSKIYEYMDTVRWELLPLVGC